MPAQISTTHELSEAEATRARGLAALVRLLARQVAQESLHNNALETDDRSSRPPGSAAR
jgi:hypothetical protein